MAAITARTPGPWSVAWGESDNPDRILIRSEKGVEIAEVMFTPEQKSCHTGNAYVFGAALDLLAACEAALATHTLGENEPGLPTISEVGRMLSAAILKAKGSA